MIRGYLLTRGGRRRPFVNTIFLFPGLPDRFLEVELLVDTGADRTTLSPVDGRRLAIELGIDFATFPTGAPSTGVGGQVGTRVVEATITLDNFSMPLLLTLLESPPNRPMPAIPSLLGRDVISLFALFFEQRTERVLLLEQHEADALMLP